jgi:hypothetical protein
VDSGRATSPGAETDPVPAFPPLPDRPQLLPGTPVLVRAPDEVQVGIDPDRAVLLRGAGPRRLVSRLDGVRGLPELHRCGAAAGLAAQEVETVLQALHRAGLLADGHPVAAAVRGPVRLAGVGRLGQQVASLLLDAGFDVYAADLDGHGAPPRFGPEGEALGAWTPSVGRLTLVSHWSKPDRDDLDLTVVAADTAEADRVVTDHLLRADQPHLLVRSTGSTVTVGPLVIPGRTPCLRCADLGRRDVDPAWPQVLSQLVHLRPPTSPVLAAWAGSVAAAQALAFLAGAVPEVVGATLELSARDHLMRWRAWPRHPGCGCAWSGTTQWGP